MREKEYFEKKNFLIFLMTIVFGLSLISAPGSYAQMRDDSCGCPYMENQNEKNETGWLYRLFHWGGSENQENSYGCPRCYDTNRDNYNQNDSQNGNDFRNSFLERLDNDSQFRREFFERLDNDSEFRNQFLNQIRGSDMWDNFSTRFDTDSRFRRNVLDLLNSDSEFRSNLLHRLDDMNVDWKY